MSTKKVIKELEICIDNKKAKIIFNGIKSKSLKIIFNTVHEGSAITCLKIFFTKQKVEELINILELYIDSNIEKENGAYCEEFSTFRRGIERTLNISKLFSEYMQLSLVCYTDNDSDANWISLSQKKLKSFIGFLYGYTI